MTRSLHFGRAGEALFCVTVRTVATTQVTHHVLFLPSMYAYQREKLKEEKRKSLEARRQRLRQLMLEEQDLLVKELEELRLSMNLRERRIRERHGDLKSAREEQRKLVTVRESKETAVGAALACRAHVLGTLA